MEVKSIFANLIMKNYENTGSARQIKAQAESPDREDSVSISPQSSKRLFGDLMEHSLKKGLSGVRKDEN